MSSIEDQLTEYRARKRREQKEENSTKNKILYLLGANQSYKKMNVDIPGDGEKLLPNGERSDDVEDDDISFRNMSRNTYIKIAWFLLWFVIYLLFVKLKWGSVFFIISALIFICANTSTGQRKIGEISAYSVFNKDCKTIDGTLTAEQFDRELRYGPGSV